MPSSDGQRAFRFSSIGGHLATFDVMTGKPVLSFEYADTGRLVSVTDVDKLKTTITRDASGQATEITGPYRQATRLEHDTAGNLASVSAAVDARPDRTRAFEYDPDSGLLSVAQGGDGNRYDCTFHALGRVTNVAGPMGFSETYSGAITPGTQDVGVGALPPMSGSVIGMSPYGHKVLLKRSHFVDSDPSKEIDLKNVRAASTFAHESLHVWQRYRGRAVTEGRSPKGPRTSAPPRCTGRLSREQLG